MRAVGCADVFLEKLAVHRSFVVCPGGCGEIMVADARYALAVCTNDNCQFRFCVKCRKEARRGRNFALVGLWLRCSGSAFLRHTESCHVGKLQDVVNWVRMPLPMQRKPPHRPSSLRGCIRWRAAAYGSPG
jgi:hypothetical protein